MKAEQNSTPKMIAHGGHQRRLSASQKVCLALSATWVAGFVDATGWLLLAHIYTANMTGNSIEMSVHWIDGNWSGILQRGWPVAMFVAGLVIAAIATEICVRHNVRSFSALNLGAEATLLACFIPLAHPVFRGGAIHATSTFQFNLLVGLMAGAMGIQNQTVSHVGSLNFRTTHVTGTLTRFGAEVAEFCFWAYDRVRAVGTAGAISESARRPEFRGMTFNLGLWVSFVIGAIAAVVFTRKWGVLGLIAPVAVIVFLTVIDLVWPIAASAEVEEIRKHRGENYSKFVA